uniref:Groucho/TLE N-terminal Q-rich domain-containing protein n=1 Tax=Ditylenchus dipsaci TaxID=166011 RepID=A0A915DFQ9_9BILA
MFQSQNRHPGTSHNNQSMKLPANEYLDRLREEFGLLHSQLSNARLDIEKINQEKEVVQRHYLMYYEIACNVNVEVHKQAEIVKRLSGILGHVIPLLPPEHQASAIQAVERAKAINQQELQAIVGTQMQQQQLASMMPGMAGLGGMMAGDKHFIQWLQWLLV